VSDGLTRWERNDASVGLKPKRVIRNCRVPVDIFTVVNVQVSLQTRCSLVGCNQRFTERYTVMFRVQFPPSGQGRSTLTRRQNKTITISLSFNSPPAEFSIRDGMRCLENGYVVAFDTGHYCINRSNYRSETRHSAHTIHLFHSHDTELISLHRICRLTS
jgi:hypothetical protein